MTDHQLDNSLTSMEWLCRMGINKQLTANSAMFIRNDLHDTDTLSKSDYKRFFYFLVVF